jgi:sigma-B regulation protein RsbU (phosphoserine phosphatase)
VRAGHDAALLYDPANDRFENLYGSGLALGLDENYPYQENEWKGLATGQIIYIGTDGIWEAINSEGKLFGKTPIKEIIRQNAAASADQILNAILTALNRFRQGLELEDDATLVVLKITDDVSHK